MMTSRRIRRLALAGATALLLGAGAFGVQAEALDADECSGPGEVLCKENESCAAILFFWQCTTRYDYWDV